MDNYATNDEVVIKTAVENIDLILGAAKRLKSAHKKHETKKKAEEELRNEARELTKKAHAVMGEMVNEAIGEERKKELMQENARIQKELAKTNTKVDKAIDKGNEAWEAVGEAHAELVRMVNGQESEVREGQNVPADPEAPEQDSSEQETADDA